MGNKATYELGQQSVKFEKPVYIVEAASVAGRKEKEGRFSDCFDMTSEDDKFGENTWEAAESTLQKLAVEILIEKAKISRNEIHFMFAGDLLGQAMATSFGLKELELPLFGLYGACSTCGEALSLGAMAVSGGFATNVVCVTSSHYASAEKEFRFPLEYGGQRPPCAGYTSTASGAFLLSSNPRKHPLAKITGFTTGKIMDYGIKDSFNMGCAMAPAAMNVISTHLKDFERKTEEYDRIVTGDLGKVGSEALHTLLCLQNIDVESIHEDCGALMYNEAQENIGAGGSGCGCSASILACHFLRKIQDGSYKRLLFIPTGALLSKTSFNEGQTVPGIAHGVCLEQV